MAVFCHTVSDSFNSSLIHEDPEENQQVKEMSDPDYPVSCGLCVQRQFRENSDLNCTRDTAVVLLSFKICMCLHQMSVFCIVLSLHIGLTMNSLTDLL